MEVRIVDRPELDGADIYFLVDVGSSMRLSGKVEYDSVGHGRLAWPGDRQVEYGSEPLRTLHLDNVALDALRRALLGEALDRDDALADTRQVRDRLLALVEEAWRD